MVEAKLCPGLAGLVTAAVNAGNGGPLLAGECQAPRVPADGVLTVVSLAPPGLAAAYSQHAQMIPKAKIATDRAERFSTHRQVKRAAWTDCSLATGTSIVVIVPRSLQLSGPYPGAADCIENSGWRKALCGSFPGIRIECVPFAALNAVLSVLRATENGVHASN